MVLHGGDNGELHYEEMGGEVKYVFEEELEFIQKIDMGESEKVPTF